MESTRRISRTLHHIPIIFHYMAALWRSMLPVQPCYCPEMVAVLTYQLFLGKCKAVPRRPLFRGIIERRLKSMRILHVSCRLGNESMRETTSLPTPTTSYLLGDSSRSLSRCVWHLTCGVSSFRLTLLSSHHGRVSSPFLLQPVLHEDTSHLKNFASLHSTFLACRFLRAKRVYQAVSTLMKDARFM